MAKQEQQGKRTSSPPMTNRLLEYDDSAAPPRLEPPRPGELFSRASQWPARVEKWIGDHPASSLATAIAVGVFIGWLAKRK